MATDVPLYVIPRGPLFNHRSPDGVDDPHVRIADKIPSMPRGTRSTHLLLVNVKLSCDGGVVETSPHRSLGNLKLSFDGGGVPS